MSKQTLHIASQKTLETGLVEITGTFKIYVPGIETKPYAAKLIPLLLDEGTKKYSKQELHQTIAGLGSHISWSMSWLGLSFRISTLPENTQKTLSLLKEILEHASFPQDAFSRIKKHMLEELRTQQDDTAVRAYRAFTRHIYDTKHPGYKTDLKKVIAYVSKLTHSDIVQTYKTLLKDAPLVLSVAGNVQKNTEQLLLKACGDLMQKPTQAIPAETKHKEMAPATEVISLSHKNNVDVYLGHSLGLTIKNEDYYPLLVGVALLGKSGFSARLPRIVREEAGLTYHISARIETEFDTLRSAFVVVAKFPTQNTKKGIALAKKVIKEAIAGDITEEEFARIKQSMIGNVSTYYADSASILSLLHMIQIRGRNPDFIQEHVKKIQYVTLKEVQNALRKYIKPDTFTIVAAGSIDEQLKPLS